MSENYLNNVQKHFITFQMDNNELKSPSTSEEFNQYAKSIFNTAESYYYLSSLGLRHDYSLAVDAIITNISFACELYIKAILVKEKSEKIRGHHLKELFELISDEAKARIKTAVGMRDFELYLGEINKAFEVSRYVYEYKRMGTNLILMIKLMQALRGECIQLFKLQSTETKVEINDSGEQAYV